MNRWQHFTTGRGPLAEYWAREGQEIRPLLVANVPTDVVEFELVDRGRAVDKPFHDLKAAKAAAGPA